MTQRLFDDTEYLPLFSGNPQRVKETPFKPREVTPQLALLIQCPRETAERMKRKHDDSKRPRPAKLRPIEQAPLIADLPPVRDELPPLPKDTAELAQFAQENRRKIKAAQRNRRDREWSKGTPPRFTS